MHKIVVGLGFGDEGKGATVDWLCAGEDRPNIVVRYCGGAQAGHNVVDKSRRIQHTFSQWGSGTLRGVPTVLSRFMLVEPHAMMREAEFLRMIAPRDPMDMMYVDENALVVTPWHRYLNIARENLRSKVGSAHGSCLMGMGETQRYANEFGDIALLVRDLDSISTMAYKLGALETHVLGQIEQLANITGAPQETFLPGPEMEPPRASVLALGYQAWFNDMRVIPSDFIHNTFQGGEVVFEGAQGALLDEWWGFHPHTTWATTTPANAWTLLAEAGCHDAEVIGVVRTTTTRHGSGPLPTYDPLLHPDRSEANISSGPQGAFRIGHFDAVAHRYAINICGQVDGLAITHADRMKSAQQTLIVHSYDVAGAETTFIPKGSRDDDLDSRAGITMGLQAAAIMKADPLTDPVEQIHDALGVPVHSVSYGPTAEDRKLL